MYFSKILQNVIAAGCVFSLLCGAAPAFAHEATQEDEAFYISFQVRGSRTFPQAINEFVSVTGNYIDASGRQHGFVRDVWGKIETFDPPDSTLTAPTSINGEGTIAGYYADAKQVQHGFVRYTTGKIKTFDPPGSLQTIAESINARGTITGYYQQSPLPGDFHSFVRNADDGEFTTFDPPGCVTSFAHDINRKGGITGFAQCPSLGLGPNPVPFLRDPKGTANAFPINVGGWALSINNYGFAAGSLRGTGQAFLLSPQGTFTTFDVRGNSFTTTPISINDEQAIAGTCITGPGCGIGTSIGNHGFVISPQGKVTAFDPPVPDGEQVFTVATSINNLGVITGSYVFYSSPGDCLPNMDSCAFPCRVVSNTDAARVESYDRIWAQLIHRQGRQHGTRAMLE